MKVSVIISVFNRVDVLAKCLISLSNQSCLPDEVIITDDGSSENTQEILKKELPFDVYYCCQKDIGFRLARCKNNGVISSSGDILVFLDQDIITTKDYIRTIRDNIKKSDFLVSLPIRLSEMQSEKISFQHLTNCKYDDLIYTDQIKKVKKQYFKEKLYRSLYKLRLRKTALKLRGGAFAVYRKDLLEVNGFDENYTGWGNEDDDLGQRLSFSGITGKNPFLNDYSLHLYHPTNNPAGIRVNQEYYRSIKQRIKDNLGFCEYGINNRRDKDEVKCIRIK